MDGGLTVTALQSVNNYAPNLEMVRRRGTAFPEASGTAKGGNLAPSRQAERCPLLSSTSATENWTGAHL